MKSSQPLATRHEKTKLAPHKKSSCGQGEVYAMENKDTNTDYQEVVRGPKVINCRNYNQYQFLCLKFVFTIFYTGSFQVLPEKIYPHLKC